MSNTARELVGWTEERWNAVQEAAEQSIERTAKCRSVIPIAPDQIGAKTVLVPTVKRGKDGGYHLDTENVITPEQLSMKLKFDDRHSEDEEMILRLVESAAAELGSIEDKTVLAKGTNESPRKSYIISKKMEESDKSVSLTSKNGTGLINAVSEALSKLEANIRPGPCGLLLGTWFFSLLCRPVEAGKAPPLHQIEPLIGSSEITGTSALAGKDACEGDVCGILFRNEPAALDIVFTQTPTVTVVERTGGETVLRVEEELATRMLDEAGVILIKYHEEES